MPQEHCAGYDNSIQYQGNEYLCRPSCYFNIVSVLNSSSLCLLIHCQWFFGLILSFFMLVFGVVLVALLVCRAFIGLRSIADHVCSYPLVKVCDAGYLWRSLERIISCCYFGDNASFIFVFVFGAGLDFSESAATTKIMTYYNPPEWWLLSVATEGNSCFCFFNRRSRRDNYFSMYSLMIFFPLNLSMQLNHALQAFLFAMRSRWWERLIVVHILDKIADVDGGMLMRMFGMGDEHGTGSEDTDGGGGQGWAEIAGVDSEAKDLSHWLIFWMGDWDGL